MSDKPVIGPDDLFVVATSGDGYHSMLVRGRDELRAAVCASLWMGQLDDAPEDVRETLADLDDPDDWPGPSTFWSWGRSYEDGSIFIQRVCSAPLLEANTCEVERRREAEALAQELAGALVDEGSDWSDAELAALRRRVCLLFPGDHPYWEMLLGLPYEPPSSDEPSDV